MHSFVAEGQELQFRDLRRTNWNYKLELSLENCSLCALRYASIRFGRIGPFNSTTRPLVYIFNRVRAFL